MLPEELGIFYLHIIEYILGTRVISKIVEDTLSMARMLNRKGPRADLWLQGQFM